MTSLPKLIATLCMNTDIFSQPQQGSTSKLLGGEATPKNKIPMCHIIDIR